MIQSEQIGLARDLFTEDGYCHLNHGPDTQDYKIQAVDYLVIPLGKKNDIGIVESSSELTIPVCQECLDGINDPNWILIFCLNCIASQWIYKSKAKLNYRQRDLDYSYKGIILNGCSKCTNKFNGIWYIL